MAKDNPTCGSQALAEELSSSVARGVRDEAGSATDAVSSLRSVMRKLMLKMSISMDGFCADSDPDGPQKWLFDTADDESNAWEISFLKDGEWARLFLAPGMGHCGGGEGPNVFDPIAALEQWVEHGRAPGTITASHSTDGKVDRNRLLCPYPQVAKYRGTGSSDEAGNFACQLP